MIDIDYISNMTNDEMNEDIELRDKLLKELKDVKCSVDLNNTCTHDLFQIYKLIKI